MYSPIMAAIEPVLGMVSEICTILTPELEPLTYVN